ncbi:MAG: hypothetical protein QOI88_1409 [Gammaproteobacteria bacterium]|nr:hypothetical protein [Gammaproteobacteria bacterium]
MPRRGPAYSRTPGRGLRLPRSSTAFPCGFDNLDRDFRDDGAVDGDGRSNLGSPLKASCANIQRLDSVPGWKPMFSQFVVSTTTRIMKP